MKNILTIAGSDSCGGAGIQADLKTMCALGVHGMSVITAITAQNSKGVFAVQEVSEDIIEKQLEVLFEDIEIDAIKIGMLSSDNVIKIVSSNLKKYSAKNIIIDTIMLSKNKYKLLSDEGIKELKNLISLGTVITPNIPEAEVLANIEIKNEADMIEAGKKIQSFGAKNVLIKGGHRKDNCTDILILENGKIVKFPAVRIETKNTHGTGCTLSSAIASFIGKGYSVEESVKFSKDYINQAIKNSFPLGKGVGPLGHLIELYKKAKIEY